MTGTPAATERRHRSLWVDPRFVAGIALVLVSVIGVVWLVRAADDTTPVYIASETVASGQRLTQDDLAIARVRLTEVSARYLSPGAIPDEGVVAVRAIGRGEMIPEGAVGTAAGENRASVVVTVSAPLPRSVGEASAVTLWASTQLDRGGEFAAPVVLVSGASVVRVLEATGLVASSAEVQVELFVPRDAVAAVLEARANGAALALIPDDQPVTG